MASAELLRRLLRDCPAGADQAEYVAKRLEQIEDVREARGKFEASKRRLESEFKRGVADFDGRLAELQKRCLHEETEYQRDPSGGGDSVTVCLICGKTWDHSVSGYDG